MYDQLSAVEISKSTHDLVIGDCFATSWHLVISGRQFLFSKILVSVKSL